MNQAEVKRKQIQLYSYVVCGILLLYFGNMLGNSGLAYLLVGTVGVIFFMPLIAGNVADVMGRMLRYRRKRGQYVDVCVVRKRLNFLLIGISVVCSLLVFCLADVLADKLLKVENVGVIIRILTPLLIIRMALSLLQGHFQSFGSQLQTAFSYILRPIFYFIFTKAITGKTMEYGEKVAVLLREEEFAGMYGAVGIACAVILSELIILGVMLVFFLISDRQHDKKKSKEGLQKQESLKETFIIYGKLSGAGVGAGMIFLVMMVAAIMLLRDKEMLGIYLGRYFAVCAIPILFACSRYYLLYAKTVYAIKGQNGPHIREMIQLGMKYAWCIGVLACVILAVLAPQITTAFFEGDGLVERVLQNGSVLIPLLLMFVYLITIHVAHNRYMGVFLTLFVNVVLFVLLGIFMKGRMESTLLAIVYAGMIAVGVAGVVLCLVTIQMYRLQIEYIVTFVLPLVCGGIVGLLLMLLTKLLTPHIGNLVCFFVSVILGGVLFLVLLGVCRIFMERDINQLYGKVGRKYLSFIFK